MNPFAILKSAIRAALPANDIAYDADLKRYTYNGKRFTTYMRARRYYNALNQVNLTSWVPGGGDEGFTVAFTGGGSVSGVADTSPKTVSGVALGSPSAAREVFLAVAGFGSGTISSSNDALAVTIGGVAADLVVNRLFSNTFAAIYRASVPTGTSGDVVLDYSAGSTAYDLQAAGVAAYRVTGAAAVLPNTDQIAGNVNSMGHNVDVSEGGAAIVAQMALNASQGLNWTIGVTEDYEVDIDADDLASFASATELSAEVNKTITSNTPDGANIKSAVTVAIDAAA